MAANNVAATPTTCAHQLPTIRNILTDTMCYPARVNQINLIISHQDFFWPKIQFSSKIRKTTPKLEIVLKCTNESVLNCLMHPSSHNTLSNIISFRYLGYQFQTYPIQKAKISKLWKSWNKKTCSNDWNNKQKLEHLGNLWPNSQANYLKFWRKTDWTKTQTEKKKFTPYIEKNLHPFPILQHIASLWTTTMV